MRKFAKALARAGARAGMVCMCSLLMALVTVLPGNAHAQISGIEVFAGGAGPFPILDSETFAPLRLTSNKTHVVFLPHQSPAGVVHTAATFEVTAAIGASVSWFGGSTTGGNSGSHSRTIPLPGRQNSTSILDLSSNSNYPFSVILLPNVTNIEILPGDSTTALAMTPSFTAHFTAEVATSFIARVASDVTSVKVKPTYGISVTTFTAGKSGETAAAIASGASGGAITLAESGDTVIEATATHDLNLDDKFERVTFRITVSKTPASTNANLSGITVNDGAADVTLTPASFSPAVTTYRATVGASIAQVTVTPALQDSKATFSIEKSGAAQSVSGGAANVELTYGENRIDIRVTAEDQSATKSYALFVTRMQPSPPSAPQNFSAAPGDAAVNLNWGAPADNGGGEITGYRFRWSNDNDDSTWESASGAAGVGIAADVTLPHAVTSLTNGTTYALQVAAENAGGTGAWTQSRTARPLGAPDVPQNLSVTSAVRALQVSWDAPAQTGGVASGELQYDVRWQKQNNASAGGTFETAAGAREHEIANLDVDTDYFVSVRAKSSGGMSAFSGNNSDGRPFAFRIDLGGASGEDWRDAVVAVRYVAGIGGAELIAGLSFAADTDTAAIAAKLAANVDELNVDGDAQTTLRDVILIARYLLEVRGVSLFAGQVEAADTDAQNVIIGRIEKLLTP